MNGIKVLAVALALATGAAVMGAGAPAEAAQKHPVAEYTLRVVTYNYDAKGNLVGQRTTTSGRFKLRSDVEKAAKETSRTFTNFGRKTVISATVVVAK